jgi:hypothetical protein
MTRSEFQAAPAAEKCKYMVKKLAQRTGKSEQQIWGLAYTILSRKLGYNIKARAQEAEVSVIRYVDQAGHSGSLKRTLKQIHDDRSKGGRK